jgi:hypothetical protein
LHRLRKAPDNTRDDSPARASRTPRQHNSTTVEIRVVIWIYASHRPKLSTESRRYTERCCGGQLGPRLVISSLDLAISNLGARLQGARRAQVRKLSAAEAVLLNSTTTEKAHRIPHTALYVEVAQKLAAALRTDDITSNSPHIKIRTATPTPLMHPATPG